VWRGRSGVPAPGGLSYVDIVRYRMEIIKDIATYHRIYWYTGGMDDSRAGRHLASLRKTREKTCPVCGTVFEAFAKQTYDSKLCANRASYARHAEKRRAEKRAEYRRSREPVSNASPEDSEN
jgi:hypothetical protein